MSKKMLVDASHTEETRVVVADGHRVEDFDFETATKKQISGNIYLAKVTRVEPSLQAAFVDYGGNRHGFLAFAEIHPDFYQIPVADRQALLEEEAREAALAAAADDEEDDAVAADDGTESDDDEAQAAKPKRGRGGKRGRRSRKSAATEASDDAETADESDADANADGDDDGNGDADDAVAPIQAAGDDQPDANDIGAWNAHDDDTPETMAERADAPTVSAPVEDAGDDGQTGDGSDVEARTARDHDPDADGEADAPSGRREAEIEEIDTDADAEVETVGASDAREETPRKKPRMRNYKIQEVIKRRQLILVQVVKEERGNKGAALTTYLSLAGRYCVLMPNTARGGGISRKITNASDRKRLKKIAQELDVPIGMGLIVRTAGANRTKAEIKRDFEYLLRLWENVREFTLRSTAPALVHEEGSLIKRAIRDLYSKDIESITVEGEEGYREAKDFMKMLMPSHAKHVQPYKEQIPLFTRYRVESQLDSLLNPEVQLKSGGYIVINPTEALVSIDVNSGKSTREHSIEDTALRTNLEAAEEVARQLRLRDLAGLIVIDFIDMEENRNNRAVERKLKDCLKADRARIQVGRISAFGLLEMSRQRLRPSVLETSTLPCAHCHGTGHMRSVESMALYALRRVEEEGMQGRTAIVAITVSSDCANYILNRKRHWIGEIEERYDIDLEVYSDPKMTISDFALERVQARDEPLVIDAVAEIVREEKQEREAAEDDDDRNKRRRRRRKPRRRGRDEDADVQASEDAGEAIARSDESDERESAGTDDGDDEDSNKRRRRGRRGGRRRGRKSGPQVGGYSAAAVEGSQEVVVEDRAALEGFLAEHPEGLAPANDVTQATAEDAAEAGGETRPADDGVKPDAQATAAETVTVPIVAGDAPAETAANSNAASEAAAADPAPAEPATEPAAAKLPESNGSAVADESDTSGASDEGGDVALGDAPNVAPDTPAPVSEARRDWWRRRFGLGS